MEVCNRGSVAVHYLKDILHKLDLKQFHSDQYTTYYYVS